MSRIRGLELLFNLQKNNFKSKEDCAVAVFHCLLINEGFQCAGVGDDWESESNTSTELLPHDWNKSKEMYSLRYNSKVKNFRVLLKIIKTGNSLSVHVVKNEDLLTTMTVPVEKYVSDDYNEYCNAYKDLESLSESFRKEVTEKFNPKVKKPGTSTSSKGSQSISNPLANPPARPLTDSERHDLREPYLFPFPKVGGSDLDPFSLDGGGMLMDPSSFGIPRPRYTGGIGIGGPSQRGGLPRGSVPPGARFDPFMPPGAPGGFNPNPDHFRAPDDYFF